MMQLHIGHTLLVENTDLKIVFGNIKEEKMKKLEELVEIYYMK